MLYEEMKRLMSLKVEKKRRKVAYYIVNHDSLPTGYQALIPGDPWVVVARSPLGHITEKPDVLTFNEKASDRRVCLSSATYRTNMTAWCGYSCINPLQLTSNVAEYG